MYIQMAIMLFFLLRLLWKSISMDDYFLKVIESEIEYRPPSINIGRVYKICVLLGQLLLAPKCSPKSQTLVEK